MRIIYAAGLNTWTRCSQLAACPYWLLSVTLVRTRKGIPDGLAPWLTGRHILWDPGTFSSDAISYQNYRRFITDHIRREHKYLQYDEIGDPESTAWYLSDMRRRGLNPVPILTPGGSTGLLDEPELALGGLVPMTTEKRTTYLDALFYPEGIARRIGHVHLLGVARADVFRRYPATSGDSTTWIPKQIPKKRRTITEWMKSYGEQDIPFDGPTNLQRRFAV